MKTLITLAFIFSGVIASADTFEGGWDRPGYDYKNFEMFNPRPVLCQWQCQQDSRCRAWTFVKPGYQGAQARCWLKDRVPTAYRNACCTSGIIQ